MIILSLFVLSCAMLLLYHYCNAKKRKLSIHFDTISPHTTIIAFDIHGVLFEPDFFKIKQILKSNKSVFKVLLYLVWPPFIINFIKLAYKKTAPEEFIKRLCVQFKGIAPYKKLAFELANAQKPIATMPAIVAHLKKIGYELHIFSNIGSEIFNELAKHHQELFLLFSRIYVPHSANNYIGKPQHQAFFDYLNRCNTDNKQIIFIDNRIRNVNAAHACGIQGIHYKSSDQIHTVFMQLNILSHMYAKPS